MMDWHRYLLKEAVDSVFEAELKNYNQFLTEMTDANDRIKNLSPRSSGFNFLGNNYGREGNPAFKSPTLTLTLIPKMRDFLTFQKRVAYDRQMIHQLLSKMIDPCLNPEGFRDTVPECVAMGIPWMQRTQRTLPIAWSIQNSPRDMKLYDKCLPKIETYCAMKYLY